jgi:hypothetical protein
MKRNDFICRKKKKYKILEHHDKHLLLGFEHFCPHLEIENDQNPNK